MVNNLSHATTRRVVSSDDIAAMAREPRAMLINSLPGYKPAMLVGTCDSAGRTNLAIVSSHLHVGSNPPLLALILRPTSDQSERHTLAKALETGCWTLNSFSLEQAPQAHQTSAPYARDVSEFSACGFLETYTADFPAPFVASASLQIGCALREHHELSINGTHLLIGEIAHLSFPSDALRDDNSLDLSRLDLVAIAGLDTYALPTTGLRFAAAETIHPPRQL